MTELLDVGAILNQWKIHILSSKPSGSVAILFYLTKVVNFCLFCHSAFASSSKFISLINTTSTFWLFLALGKIHYVAQLYSSTNQYPVIYANNNCSFLFHVWGITINILRFIYHLITRLCHRAHPYKLSIHCIDTCHYMYWSFFHGAQFVVQPALQLEVATKPLYVNNCYFACGIISQSWLARLMAHKLELE